MNTNFFIKAIFEILSRSFSKSLNFPILGEFEKCFYLSKHLVRNTQGFGSRKFIGVLIEILQIVTLELTNENKSCLACPKDDARDSCEHSNI